MKISDFILGQEIGLSSPLDGMLEEKSRFLKRVSESDLQNFLTEMRVLKQLIFSTALESVEHLWQLKIQSVTPKEKKKGASDDPAAELTKAEAEYDTVKIELQKYRSSFLQTLEGQFKAESPIDSACCVVELKDLQRLLPPGMVSKPKKSGEEDETSLNFLSFCLSGLRVQLIGNLSAKVFEFEKTMLKPESVHANNGHGDRTVNYSNAVYERVVDDDEEGDGKKEATHFKVTYVPVQKPGSRFILFSRVSAEKLLTLTEEEKAAWEDNYGRKKIEGLKGKKARQQNMEMQWGRQFFDKALLDRQVRRGFYMASFSTDGTPIPLFFSIFKCI